MVIPERVSCGEGVVCGGVVTSAVPSLLTVDIKQVSTHKREKCTCVQIINNDALPDCSRQRRDLHLSSLVSCWSIWRSTGAGESLEVESSLLLKRELLVEELCDYVYSVACVCR